MGLYLGNRVIIGLIAALAVLSTLGVLSFLNNQQYMAASSIIAHTNNILYHAEQLLAVVVDMEAGQHGYVVTGNKIFLEPYNRAVTDANLHLKTLLQLTADNPLQQERLRSLEVLIKRKIEFTKEAVSLRKTNFNDAKEKSETLEGRVLTDKIRALLSEFKQHEKHLLGIRTDAARDGILEFIIAFGAMLCAILLITPPFWGRNHRLNFSRLVKAKLQKVSISIENLVNRLVCDLTNEAWLKGSNDSTSGRVIKKSTIKRGVPFYFSLT